MPSILEFFEDKNISKVSCNTPWLSSSYHTNILGTSLHLANVTSHGFRALVVSRAWHVWLRHIPPPPKKKKKTVVIHGILKWVSYGSLPSGRYNGKLIDMYVYIYICIHTDVLFYNGYCVFFFYIGWYILYMLYIYITHECFYWMFMDVLRIFIGVPWISIDRCWRKPQLQLAPSVMVEEMRDGTALMIYCSSNENWWVVWNMFHFSIHLE